MDELNQLIEANPPQRMALSDSAAMHHGCRGWVIAAAAAAAAVAAGGNDDDGDDGDVPAGGHQLPYHTTRLEALH